MGFPLKPPPNDSIPASLRRWFALFSAWARDRERFEKSVTSGSEFKSASERLALKRGIVVDSSRVADMSTDSPVVSLTGDLIPSADNTYNIGSAAFRYKDIRQAGTAYLGGVSTTGNIVVAGGMSVIGGASFSTLSFTTSIIGTTGQFDSIAIGSGGISNVGGITSAGRIVGVGGLSLSGGITISGSVSVLGTGANGFTGDVSPITTLTGSLGATTKRWGEIFGGTATITNRVTAGHVFALSTDANNSFNGSMEVGATFQSTDLGTFLGGITAGGLTTTGLNATAYALLKGLSTIGGVSAASLWVNGLSIGAGGITFMGGAAATVGNNFGISGCLYPTVTLNSGIGTNLRRFAQIFGGTLTTTNSAVIGGTLTVAGVDNISNISGHLIVGGNIELRGVFSSQIDNSASLGSGNPNDVTDKRFSGCYLAGILTTAKGTDIPSGTTLGFSYEGNYFDVTGVSTIAGITYSGTIADPQAGIFNFIRLDSNPTVSHHATRLQMSGSTDFVGYTGDHLMMISDGGGNWREAFRSYRPMAYGSCSAESVTLGWSQAAAASLTFYEISDTGMGDGVLSLVTHDGSGELTVTRPGVYKISYTVAATTDTAATDMQSAVYISGVGSSNGLGDARFTTANVSQPLHGELLIRLATGATVDVRIRHTGAGTPTLGVNLLDIVVTQVGW